MVDRSPPCEVCESRGGNLNNSYDDLERENTEKVVRAYQK
jgi:hypothetical protein